MRASTTALLIGLSLAVASACSKSPGTPATKSVGRAGDSGAVASASTNGPAQIAEREPNDSPQLAQPLDRFCTVNGEIQAVQPATKPDEDWYVVQPTQLPQDVSVKLFYRGPAPAEPASGKFSLEAYNRDHDRVETRSGPLTVGTLASLPPLRVRDVLFIRVAGSPFSYSLDVQLSTPDLNSEAEPNDRAVDATPLALDHPLRGSYGSASDKDYYAIELAPDAGLSATTAQVAIGDGSGPAPVGTGEPGELLRIAVTAIPGVRHSLTLFDDAQVPLASFSSHEVGDPLMVRDFALRPGLRRVTLLLEAAHVGRKASAEFPSGQPYTLTAHRDPAPPDLELEPNDTLELATPLVPRNPVPPTAQPAANAAAIAIAAAEKGTSAHRIGYLSPSGDVDDYRLHLDAPARIRVALSALDRVDTDLSVVEAEPPNAAGKTILKVNEGGTKEPEVIPAIALGAGDHFIRVQAAAHQVGTKWVRDQEDPGQTYQLDVDVLADDGSFEREPNDTAEQATPILPGQTLSGFAFPAKDVDVYRLDLSNQPIPAGVSFKLTGVSKVPLMLELRENRDGKLGELLNSADSSKPGTDSLLQQKLDPGVYFLIVKPHPASRSAGLPQSDSETPYKLTVQLQ